MKAALPHPTQTFFFLNLLGGRVVWGRMDTCIHMAETLSCPPETTTTLLISSTPTQNVFVLKKKDLIGYLILLQNASYFYHGDCQVYIKVERIVQ